MQIRPFSEQLESTGQDLITLLMDVTPEMAHRWQGVFKTLQSLRMVLDELGISNSKQFSHEDMEKYFRKAEPE